ncbi:hypothetical protein [Campylobacter sp. CCUG 57310]|uniref:hypothetical protein n=1 Tax=Campylobacter sp. CCUG 57310 TaxID=2517362 RepID=UPI0015655651|nr:hypothetical protein [Campylobacter sp. CCUG 57310]QKF93213.1 hypothetical protein CORI_a027 [Campylobacter sp. CCUG 57310]
MKKSNLILCFMLLLLGTSVAFGAGEFDNVDKVVKNLDTSVTTTSGTFMKNVIGWTPVIAFLGGMFMGYRHAKKEGNQHEESNKIGYTMAIAAVVGAVVGVLIDALIGTFLLQDSLKGLLVLKNYWTSALGL